LGHFKKNQRLFHFPISTLPGLKFRNLEFCELGREQTLTFWWQRWDIAKTSIYLASI